MTQTMTISPLNTLAAHLPGEWTASEYSETPAWKLRDVKVIASYETGKVWRKWPGTHKHVYFWVVLDNGKAVGMNEGPNGWTFPVITYGKKSKG